MEKQPMPTSLPIYAEELQQQAQDRLSRIEGQLRGVGRMLEQQRPCVEVLQQLASTQAALRGVTKTILRNYLQCCVTEGIKSGNCDIYDELMEVLFKFVK